MYEKKQYKTKTNEYLAPEIANALNRFNYTNMVDIYALGVLFVDIISEGTKKNEFNKS